MLKFKPFLSNFKQHLSLLYMAKFEEVRLNYIWIMYKNFHVPLDIGRVKIFGLKFEFINTNE